MKRKALIVGINYPGTSYPLNGCVNDANLIADILTDHFGFSDANNRRMLTDESATTAAILERLEWLVEGAEAGDILWFSYSGHGSQLINQTYDTDDYEPDNKDEVICPIDLNWRDKVIRDDDLKRIFDKVPNGVNLTILLDCCNSGSGLDQDSEYQPLGLATRAFNPTPESNRFLPMPDDIANRGRGLELDIKPRSVQSRDVNQTGMLITGCQSHQTSADAWIDRKYMGAATYYLVDTLRNHNFVLSYKTLIDEMNQAMVAHGYTQRPQLDGSPDLHDSKFLEPLVMGTGLEEPQTAPIDLGDNTTEVVVQPEPVEVVVPNTEPVEVVKPKKNYKLWIAIAAAVIVAGVVAASFM